VSRRHALLYRDEAGARILDDRSLNGVFKNGDRVELAELDDGDEISIGRFSLFFVSLVGETASRSDPLHAS
jgi:pSer/pThr/pTyr-binding forkhead associated (FHA) protein